MNYSVLSSGIILVISILILIWIIQNKKKTKENKLRENFVESNNTWWNETETDSRGIGRNRAQITLARGTPRCATNQYLEKNTSDLQKLCSTTNKDTKKYKNNDIIFFEEDEYSTTEKTTDFDAKYNKIVSKVTQKPSIYLKKNFGFKDLEFDNGYITGQTPFQSVAEFLRYQTCKKYDEDTSKKQKIPSSSKRIKAQIDKNETLTDFLNDGTVNNKDDGNRPYKCLNDKTNKKENCRQGNMKRYKVDIKKSSAVQKKIKDEYHDLFGKPHDYQGPNSNYLVSRGWGYIPQYLENEPTTAILNENPGKHHTKSKVAQLCKECPVSTIQTYNFNLDKNPYVSQLDKKNREGVYFVEKGGTFQNTRNGKEKCHLCSYQSGCYAPQAGRTDMFQIQSCSDGRDRKCKECKKCDRGHEKLIKFCGEGGGSSDTECEPCTPCKPNEYKVAGCDTENSIQDNKCIPKTDCLGVPKRGDKYEDPGPGRRTYVTFDGYSGSRKENVKDEYGNTVKLETPYYGKDRVCEICDDCPEGFKLIRGCQGKNSKENAICQRVLNVENYLEKDIRPPKGYFYNVERVKNYLYKRNLEIQSEDEKIRNDYINKHNSTKNIDPSRYPLSKINSPEIFSKKPLPDISDKKLLQVGKQKCRVCPPGFYTDPNDPGCSGRVDTKCIPHTKCKTDGTETIKIAGTPTSDVVCGPCKCPEGLIGTAPICNGTLNVKNCAKNIPCELVKPGTGSSSARKIIGTEGDKTEKLFTFDKPSAYGDSTRPDRCKVCDKKCPAGKFQLGECDPNRSTNIVCQDHTKCDPETQIVVEPGTATSDTICKCIDGYQWSKDEYGIEDIKKPCVEIKGKCHTNPCHPEAICYDNFNENGEFVNFVCKCDLDKNYIETGDLGVGPKGCIKVSDKHHHPIPDIDANVLSAPQISDYLDILESKPSIVSTLAHTRGLAGTDLNGLFHAGPNKPHLHK